MTKHLPCTIRLFSVLILGVGLLFWAGCDSNDPLDDTEEDEPLRQISYELDAQENVGTLPEGVEGEVAFWELNDRQTLVTLELTGETTGLDRAHPAYIRNNDTTEGGEIAFDLSPIDGSAGDATSARILDESFDNLVNFDGYVNVHESVGNLENVISQGNIGENADGTEGTGLDLVEEVRSTSYELSGLQNDGTIAPEGIPGTASFQELTEDQTLVIVTLDSASGAEVGHAVHLRNNSATEGGSTEYYLSPIDGTDESARSAKIVELPYDTLTTYDGYINVYESVANRGDVIAQGNIGSNANEN